MVEFRLLDVRGQSDDRRARVQQGFRDVRSKAAAGSGDKSSFSKHKSIRSNWNTS
jgi:hypothetical protein